MKGDTTQLHKLVTWAVFVYAGEGEVALALDFGEQIMVGIPSV